jgi:putative sterol carrier protein
MARVAMSATETPWQNLQEGGQARSRTLPHATHQHGVKHDLTRPRVLRSTLDGEEGTMQFGTEAWLQEYQAQLNASESYERSAKDWKGDFCLVVGPDGGQGEERYLFLGLRQGKCTGVGIMARRDERPVEFVVSGPLAVWRKVVEGKLDPIQALMMRKLLLHGNLAKVMRYPKAAKELMVCAARERHRGPCARPGDDARRRLCRARLGYADGPADGRGGALARAGVTHPARRLQPARDPMTKIHPHPGPPPPQGEGSIVARPAAFTVPSPSAGGGPG